MKSIISLGNKLSPRLAKRAALFRCNLCVNKRFCRIDKLLEHLDTHSDKQLFVCAICGKAFGRLHDRNKHERLHSIDSSGTFFTCSGISRSGRRWGCGRTFLGAGALRHHFQSKAGYDCIKLSLDEELHYRFREGRQYRVLSESSQPGSRGSGLPASLPTQYPSPVLLTGDLVDALSGGNSGSGLPNKLEDCTANEFAAKFARYLTYSSGAHTWGKPVLARLGYSGLFSQLNAILTAYSAELLRNGHTGSYSSLSEAIQKTSKTICLYFCIIINARPSGILQPNYFGTANTATEQFNRDSLESKSTAIPVDECSSPGKSQDLLKITDEFISTDSFGDLSLLVRENLYSTPGRSMKHIKEACMVANHYRSGTDSPLYGTPTTFTFEAREVTIITNFSLLHFIRSNFSGQRVELSTLITITGTTFYAYATTCHEYLEKTWNGREEILLPTLQKAIREILDEGASEAKFNLEHGQLLESSAELHKDGTLKLHTKGPETLVVDIIQQLCWLNAAFSTLPLGQEDVVYCTSIINLTGSSSPAKSVFQLNNSFQKLLVGENRPCWLSLFPNAIIAHGFPIPKRADGVGLEMSKELMAAIIGARHLAVFDGGVVIKGFSSMFLPVARTKDGIQWHYVANSDPDVQLSYEEGVKRCPNRALFADIDFSSLDGARCFIGWNSLVEIRVGSETNDFNNIEYSDAKEIKPTLQIPSASVGFQQFGLAQINLTLGKRDGKCHFQRGSSYRRIVSASEKMVVVLFDTGERRGYLTSASRLLLHILRHRMSLGLGGVTATRVKITLAGGITETLLRNAKLRISSREDEPLSLDDAVSEIWSILELLHAQSISVKDKAPLEMHSTWQERLLGYEYMGIVQDRSPMPLKQLEIHKTCGGWPRLARDIDALVLLANGFGDLIQPIDKENVLCHQWKTLPRHKDYMAIPVKILLDLYSWAGCCQTKKRLTSTDLQLHGEGTPFQPCPMPKECYCSCDRSHQVISNSSFGQICVPKLTEEKGAVVIGESKSFLKRLAIRSAPKITAIISSRNTGSDSETFSNRSSESSITTILPEGSDDDSGDSPNRFDGFREGILNLHPRQRRSEMANPATIIVSFPKLGDPSTEARQAITRRDPSVEWHPLK
ncbi:hypothetical protein O1611_g4058 [Lasiodiplodia mahajangana]|uniref:Uncharacterized protein n=1 Tax=Lasiodiplodia mahajangana TaxID=1108764 RepID=A0ACC2JQ03_9PEZI|nr:hypothetical protein O1611_g4058 [Lasiodiplodia mahajangana]